MENPPSKHSSSVTSAAINMSKLCIGAGTLALPYATFRGGLIFAPLFIAIVAVWNGISCAMIIKCKDACANFPFPDGMSSTYSKIAYAGAGWTGVFVTDFSIIVTLIGVCISYQITFTSLLQQTIGHGFSTAALTVLSAIIVYPASCAKDVGILSIFSFVGLLCLVAGVLSILIYGFYQYGGLSWSDPMNTGSHFNADKDLVLWPVTLVDATSYVGVATFCFGLCSLAFPVEESMTHRKQFGTAVLWCLIFVWSVYFFLGDLGALLYAQDPNGIQQNILSNLPESSFASTCVKLSMAGVCLLTFPLTCVVPAEMIERSILYASNQYRVKRRLPRPASTLLSAAYTTHTSYQSVSTIKVSHDDDPNFNENDYSFSDLAIESNNFLVTQKEEVVHLDMVIEEPSLMLRCVNRLAIVVISTLVAISIPCFGVIVSLIGCFTVTILSFILPAYLHLQLITKPQIREEEEQKREMEILIADAERPRLVELSKVDITRTSVSRIENGKNIVTETVNRGRARSCSSGNLAKEISVVGYKSILNLPNKVQYYVDIALAITGVLICFVATTMTSMDAWTKLQAGSLC